MFMKVFHHHMELVNIASWKIGHVDNSEETSKKRQWMKLALLGIGPRALHMLQKCSNTDLHPKPFILSTIHLEFYTSLPLSTG
jgi:hypothetical protein